MQGLANDGVALIAAHAHGVQAAGIAGVDGLPQVAGGIAVRAGQHGQIAVQAGGGAGLQVIVQQRTGGRAVRHSNDADPLRLQRSDEVLLHLRRTGILEPGEEEPVVGIAKVRGIQRVGRVDRVHVGLEVAGGGVGFGAGGFAGGDAVKSLGLERGSLRRGGNDFLGGLIVIQKVLQGRDIYVPVGVVHQAVVHAGAHAVGALQGHRQLLHIAAQKARQLHEQRGDLGLGEVGLHQRQRGVEQVVQLGHTGVFDLVQHGLDNGALALNAVPVVVDLAQAGVLQCGVAVEMVETRVHVVDDQHRVGGHLPVQRLGFHLSNVDVHAAHGVHDLHKGVEVDTDIVVHLHVEAILDGVHRQLGAAVAEGVGDPVVLVLVAVEQDGHGKATFDRDKADDVVLDVQRDQDQAVGAGVLAELGSGFGAVKLVQVGERVGVVDGLGALVSADKQDVQHIVIGKGAALGHDHFVAAMYKAGAVQILVLLGVDAAHRVNAAVVVVQQVELAVDVKRRQPGQRRQHNGDDQQHLAPEGELLFGGGFGFIFGFSHVHILPFFKRRRAARRSHA